MLFRFSSAVLSSSRHALQSNIHTCGHQVQQNVTCQYVSSFLRDVCEALLCETYRKKVSILTSEMGSGHVCTVGYSKPLTTQHTHYC